LSVVMADDDRMRAAASGGSGWIEAAVMGVGTESELVLHRGGDAFDNFSRFPELWEIAGFG
jgi:hypothetical protein